MKLSVKLLTILCCILYAFLIEFVVRRFVSNRIFVVLIAVALIPLMYFLIIYPYSKKSNKK